MLYEVLISVITMASPAPTLPPVLAEAGVKRSKLHLLAPLVGYHCRAFCSIIDRVGSLCHARGRTRQSVLVGLVAIRDRP